MYEVLNPWAEVDPVSPRGIAPRLGGLAGKKIGLFSNGKGAAAPILAEVRQELAKRFDNITFSSFKRKNYVPEAEETKAYEEWLAEQDAVVLAVGD